MRATGGVSAAAGGGPNGDGGADRAAGSTSAHTNMRNTRVAGMTKSEAACTPMRGMNSARPHSSDLRSAPCKGRPPSLVGAPGSLNSLHPPLERLPQHICAHISELLD